ncbi:FCD domain-containing protein [Mycolicibacterium sp. CBMA 361]|uniref:FCD domain-containing protein n=1 Tax=Mycolicibacterium sp. CBMA 361 TaxID=2606610 RepID=UPI0031BAB14A
MGTRRRSKSAIRELEALAEEARGLIGNDDGFSDLDLRFHLAVVEGTGSATLSELSKMLFQIIDSHNALFIAAHPRGFTTPVNKVALRSYLRLIKLLNEGSVDDAQKHWRRHLEAAGTFMMGEAEATLVEVLA